MANVRIRPGHVRPLWAGHPWVYAQAVAGLEGSAEPGDLVDVVDPQGKWLGVGFYSPGSALAVRILSREQGRTVDAAFFRERFEQAARLRTRFLGLPSADTTGYRLVHAEGDGLPGLIVDIYGQAATLQLLTIGMKRRQAEILRALREVAGVTTIVEMPSKEHQDQEGFKVEPSVVAGETISELVFRERGFEHRLPFAAAQKTGFYFDQRDNRARLEGMCQGMRVLDLCSYVGAFTLAAARGGASEIVAVDRSEWALGIAQAACERAGFGSRASFVRGELKTYLPQLLEREERFDVVVLDPPKLAHSARQLERARSMYRLWNAQAVRLCRPGGLLVTCSCSGAMQPVDFVRTVALAAADSARSATLLALGEQAPDHPTPAAFQEGRYLKAAFVRVG
ncbi:MAG TPA: class I SAM-dependent rRNA methyltransferase [Polyangiales bacterium]|nr:class I SAM-dependent rRNA methyltransferase [Polyangiales bacterium]